jgi:hypothetical protein
MFLYINGEKFHGENKKECIMEFLKQPYTSGGKIIEEVYRRTSEFIINNYELKDDIDFCEFYEAHITDDIIINCFLDLIESNPIKYRDIKFGE